MLHTLRQHRALVLLIFTKHGELPNIIVPEGEHFADADGEYLRVVIRGRIVATRVIIVVQLE
jgi:hypothetical protein